MTPRQQLVPDSSHPIDVTPTGSRVVVSRHGRVLAASDRALTLREADLPAVQYLPLPDVDPALLESSDHTSYCPYKGEASYYSVVVDGDRAQDAVWTYVTPYEPVAPIAGHLAFYPEQVEISIG